MAGIPLLSGILGSNQAEFTRSYPINLEPVAVDNKIASGQLRSPSGAVQIGTGPGLDRGGVEWNNSCYRVMGTSLVSVSADGGDTILGDVGGSGPARLDYSFTHLGIRSGTALYLYNGTDLTQVSDTDLGPVHDMIWIDGYWMTTDGTSVVVTELSDPFSVLPLKYGSAEEDPDPITGLIKVNNEAHVLNRHTIQVFRNVGGNGFPFQTIKGATIPYGCVSATAKCLYGGSFAFIGSARNEALRVYVGGNGTASPISTRTIEDALAAVADPGSIEMEARTGREEQRLLVHLPEETWVYCAEASVKVREPVWYRARSDGPYRIRNAVLAHGKAIVGDLNSAAIGELSDEVATHFGEEAQWQFDAGLIYNEGRGGIIHSLELVGLHGRDDAETFLALSLTRDGQTFNAERFLTVVPGERRKRMQWRPHARFTNYMGLRFRGNGKAGFTKLETEIEGLGA